MSDLATVLDLLDLATARGADLGTKGGMDDIALAAKRIRSRSGFAGEVLTIALAGGTGTGKSSVMNALLGEEVVATGVVRPTTQSSTAVHAPSGAVDLSRLIADLDIGTVIEHEKAGSFVLIDLPDFDSVAEAHRHVVESVLPRVDVVVWLADPEKYADPVLHAEFLAPLSSYEGQFIFAINQADRLGDDIDRVQADFAEKLRSDGFVDPAPIALTAAPRMGDPDVASLEAVFTDRLDLKRTALCKVALDVRSLASDGHTACLEDLDAGATVEQIDATALAAATFVSLGISGYELFDRLCGG